MFKEFKEFAIKGNALELAVGVVIGAAFSQVVNSLVNDILNPIISLFTGHVNFSNLKISLFGHAILYGSFLNAVINFLLVSLAIFILIRRIIQFRHEPAHIPNLKECPFCKTQIEHDAIRCPACTSHLDSK